ncbi:MAG: alpha/beta hydrolase [Gammaproteobacteria bacterium]|nr:alpha/beta hydrolase [Gammaproteobacteria bacterium]
MARISALKQLKTVLQGTATAGAKAAMVIELEPNLPDTAIKVLDDALEGAEPILQVAIMDVYFEMTKDDYHKKDLERILNEAMSGGDASEEVYMAARIALGRISGAKQDALDKWGDSGVEIAAVTTRQRTAPGMSEADKARTSITVMIHGTWASDGDWWRPNGDFFEYVKKNLEREDLYGEEDQFMWSGKNRDSKRRKAGLSLVNWIDAHPADEVNVFAHSHGANVAMLATHDDLCIDQLVMLSPPVNADYFAKWSNVKSAFNIQADFDPVVAIARGGQWFRLPQVLEKKLKASGHSASHDPEVWRNESVNDFIGIPW